MGNTIDSILVSVIVPIWNVEPYLSRCINSIINQTYKHLEVILIDDGSPDNCPAICDEYTSMDKRIRVVHKENGGLASARNAGLDIMTGDWVCFVDSDDYVDERFVEVLLKTATESGAVTARCKRAYTFKWNEKVKQPTESSSVFDWFNYILYMDNNSGYTIHSVCWGIYRSELFNDIRFPALTHTEDTPVSAQIYWNARDSKFAVTNQTLYYYYQSPRSILRGKTSLRVLDRYDSLKWLLSYWRENNEYEIGDCYFKLYFTKLIQDYTELRRDLPEERGKYEYLSTEIINAFPHALALNLKLTRISIYAKALFDDLRYSGKRLILYGYNIYCVELFPWLGYYGIDVLEIWDHENIGEYESILVKSPHSEINTINKDMIIIAFTMENEIMRAKLQREFRCLGYSEFITCDNLFSAIKYARYCEFLPELLCGDGSI